MIEKIEYEDKVAIQNDETVPEKSKVTDNNLNEIKRVVNNNADELTTANGNIANIQKEQKTQGNNLTNLQKSVNTNTKNIETNAKSIENNTKSIEINAKNIETNTKKIDTNTTAIKENTKDIRTNADAIELNASDIKDLQAENTALKTELEKQKEDNKLNGLTEDNEGELIHIDNSTGSRFNSLEIEGNENQESQDGTSNLLVLEEGSKSQNGVDFNIQNGMVNISGTATASIHTICGKAYLHEGETYYIEKVGTSSNCGFRLQNQKNGAQQHWFATSGEVSFVAEATGEWDFYMSTGKDQKPSATDLKLRVSKESGIEWEQGFMNTPSFDYPSEIKLVGDNVNFFDDVLYTKFSANSQATKEVVGKTLKVTTIANQFSGVYLSTIFPEVADLTSKIKGKTVTYSFEAKADTNINLSFGKSDVSKIRQVTNKWRKLFITYENANSCSIYFYNDSAIVTTFYIRNIKLEYGVYNSSYSDFNIGSIGLKISNKNFLNIEKDSSVESNGLKVTTDSNGILNLNGTTNNNIYLSLDLKHIGTSGGSVEQKHFKKGNYKFSCENLSSIQDLNVSAYIADKAVGTRKTFALLYKVFNQKTKTATASILEDTEAVVYLWIASGITLDNAKLKFQIELAEEATDIIANEEQNYIIPVQQKMLSGDKFIKVNGKWKEMHTWLELFFDGVNRKFNQEATNTSGKYRLLYHISEKVKDCDTTNGTKAYCSNSKLTAKGETYSCNEGFTVANNIIYIYIDGRTASAINAELQDNQITFYIPLKEDDYKYLDCTEEQIEILDKIEKEAHTYLNTTNIYTEDEIGAIIKTNTNVDLKSVINNVVETQLSQIGG